MAKTEQTDAELLSSYIAGDKNAFKEIVNRYKDMLYGFLRRFLNQQDIVEEVFQETFLQLYKSRESFDTNRALRPWLFTIAANKARDTLRKRQRDNTIPFSAISEPSDLTTDDVLNSLMSYEITPYDEATKAETAEKVREIIGYMPASLKEILLLAYFEQFSYKQMAQILSIPIGTVKSRLHTAVVHFTRKWKSVSNDGNI